ncbi:hypothetical protein DL96DRAFT_1602382 [Flagelloscypha sp. PMI_526]|nr:hypothetical protein DL96DRAFT_1602382 [Flagelloscypha sp. PMI_526]
MSPYGASEHPVNRPQQTSTTWPIRSTPSHTIVIHHLTLKTAQEHPGLIPFINQVFNDTLEDGQTYPQETVMDQQSFEQYFFAADVFVAVYADAEASEKVPTEISVPETTSLSFDATRKDRPWDQCLAGFFYVKPNYPGRSSHICNAGFVTVPEHRGKGIGTILANSFVYYAPKLGYKGSVFNLVYVNNVASVR